MNGHRQSGGHWIVAFALVTRRSGNLGLAGFLSGSGDGSALGLRLSFIMRDIPKSVAQQFKIAHS
jgi:hypothetical protein